MRPIKAIIMGSGVILTTFCVGTAVWLLQEEEYGRIKSPDARYVAIVTCRRYQSFIPKLPGQGSDKSGFIAIKDTSGVQYGKLPLVLVWIADDIRWKTGGAVLIGVGTWEFSTRECDPWD